MDEVQARAGILDSPGAPLLAAARPRAGRVVMFTADRQIDRRTLLEADSLEAAGWQVTIIALPHDDPAAADDRRVVRLGGALPVARREGGVLRLYRLVRRLLPMGSRPMRALKAFAWRYLISQEEFYEHLYAPAIAAYPAEVFVAQDLPMLPVALRAARVHGGKVVYDSHELFAEQEFSAREKKVWRAIEGRLVGQCDAVVTVNPSIARELEQRYALPRVHVIHNAERARPDAPRTRRFHEALGLSDQALVLLMQGGLSAGRHLEELVAAMAQVRHPRVHLVLLGDGTLGERLRQQVVARGLSARVHLMPAVPQRELLVWTEAADAGVIPYQATCLNNYYCTPNKLFEFIAAGIPVLASDLPEIRRFVAGHGIGQVSDLGDVGAIARAIDRFFADAARLDGWRESAARARTEVNWDVEGRKVVELFEVLR
ncbi:glycosyltransferase [Ramlibacter sp. AN1133]|uniref:glycosyltransferase n=1 Tax=Ramlibacter sp. AN1133 TaxID=3133429 RepID=UPI0030BC3145